MRPRRRAPPRVAYRRHASQAAGGLGLLSDSHARRFFVSVGARPHMMTLLRTLLLDCSPAHRATRRCRVSLILFLLGTGLAARAADDASAVLNSALDFVD